MASTPSCSCTSFQFHSHHQGPPALNSKWRVAVLWSHTTYLKRGDITLVLNQRHSVLKDVIKHVKRISYHQNGDDMFVSLGNGVFYTPFLQIFSFTLITRAHRLRIQNGGWLLSYTTYLKRGGIILVLNQRHTKDSLHCSQPTYYLHHYLQCYKLHTQQKLDIDIHWFRCSHHAW